MAKMDEATSKRVRAGRLMLAGKTPAQAASAVGVARQTAYTWKSRLDEGGIEALRSMATGRPAQLDAKQLDALRTALLQGAIAHGFGTELWTLKRVRALIERLYGVRFSEVHVWRLLGAMGFSSQKPERRAIERNDEAVLAWKRRTWPALKKSVQPSDGWSSSSTNPGCRSAPPESEPGLRRAARRSCSSTSTGSTSRPSPD
jgi:transposase